MPLRLQHCLQTARTPLSRRVEGRLPVMPFWLDEALFPFGDRRGLASIAWLHGYPFCYWLAATA